MQATRPRDEEVPVRELRAVEQLDDGKRVKLVDAAGSTAEGFVLLVDERLRTLLRPRPTTTEVRAESALTPREIQARLRAGETAEEVAHAAGIPVGRVQRYEAPILAERARIVDEVRGATAPGPHRVSPGRPVGAVVDERLREEGLDPARAEWNAYRQADGTWLVVVELEHQRAEWSWDGTARRVRAHDEGAEAFLAPSRASEEALTAVAQAAGVTANQARTPSRAVAGMPSALSAGAGRTPTTLPGRDVPIDRSHLAVQEQSPAPIGPPVATPVAPAAQRAELSVLSESATSAAPPSSPDRNGAGSLPAVPSAADAPDSDAAPAAQAAPAPASSAPAASRARATRRRSNVPAWDDIVFGTKRPL